MMKPSSARFTSVASTHVVPQSTAQPSPAEQARSQRRASGKVPRKSQDANSGEQRREPRAVQRALAELAAAPARRHRAPATPAPAAAAAAAAIAPPASPDEIWWTPLAAGTAGPSAAASCFACWFWSRSIQMFNAEPDACISGSLARTTSSCLTSSCGVGRSQSFTVLTRACAKQLRSSRHAGSSTHGRGRLGG